MSVLENAQHSHFLTLDGTVSDKKINTNEDDVITVRIQRVPGTAAYFILDLEASDSLVCDVEIHRR